MARKYLERPMTECFRQSECNGAFVVRGGMMVEEYRLKLIRKGRRKLSERCNHCGQELVEIDNRGERLTGCLSCNLWAGEGKQNWVRLSEEDLRALHELRHKGSR